MSRLNEAHRSKLLSRALEMPKTKRDGLANFIQMIINAQERGDHREALLQAVDLLEDVNCGLYDTAMIDDRAQKTQERALQDMKTQHNAEITAAYERGQATGAQDEKDRITALLGLRS
jgi:hypothetical protein